MELFNVSLEDEKDLITIRVSCKILGITFNIIRKLTNHNDIKLINDHLQSMQHEIFDKIKDRLRKDL